MNKRLKKSLYKSIKTHNKRETIKKLGKCDIIEKYIFVFFYIFV